MVVYTDWQMQNVGKVFLIFLYSNSSMFALIEEIIR